MNVKIWHTGVDNPKNCKIYEIWEYKLPVDAHLSHKSYEIYRSHGQFHGIVFLICNCVTATII